MHLRARRLRSGLFLGLENSPAVCLLEASTPSTLTTAQYELLPAPSLGHFLYGFVCFLSYRLRREVGDD